MGNLSQFAHLNIDWNLSPEHAVTLYLEWGNNDWHAEHPPVRSKEDFATYFVVDTWEEKPIIRLVRRNSENAEDLVSFAMPEFLMADFTQEYGKLKGIFEPTSIMKDWLRKEME